MVFWKKRQQIGTAAAIVGAGILLSRFMGLFRDKLISLLFGATLESDLYFAAFVIPDFINYMLAGGYFAITLIPFLTRYFEENEEDGWRFFSSVFFWVAVSICTLTFVAFLSAPDLARLAAPGLSVEAHSRLAFFLRIILPAQIFFLCGSCFSAILFMRKQFFVPALVSIVYNLFIIIGGVVLRARGMEGFCWGVLVGAFIGNFLLPLLAVRSGGGLSLRFSVRHPGLKKYFLVALPLMIGQSITVVDEQFVRIFGSLAGVGAISWLSYARRIMMVPVSVVAQAAGVASYPFMAELFVKNDLYRFNKKINSALQNVMTLLFPLSIWMILAAEPTIRLIFQQGRFGVSDTANTARLLQVLAVLERRAGLSFAGQDVYVSVAGGVRILEPAVDLRMTLLHLVMDVETLRHLILLRHLEAQHQLLAMRRAVKGIAGRIRSTMLQRLKHGRHFLADVASLAAMNQSRNAAHGACSFPAIRADNPSTAEGPIR